MVISKRRLPVVRDWFALVVAVLSASCCIKDSSDETPGVRSANGLRPHLMMDYVPGKSLSFGIFSSDRLLAGDSFRETIYLRRPADEKLASDGYVFLDYPIFEAGLGTRLKGEWGPHGNRIFFDLIRTGANSEDSILGSAEIPPDAKQGMLFEIKSQRLLLAVELVEAVTIPDPARNTLSRRDRVFSHAWIALKRID